MFTAAAPPKPIRSRRAPRCPACWLPVALCLCAELPRLAVSTRLVVVMHRREAITSTNTGRIAALALEGASVRVRGGNPRTAPDRAAPGVAAPDPLPGVRRLALFPAPGARPLSAEDAAAGHPLVLLVPDGTWPQARRLLRRDEALRAAEPVTLPDAPPSRYGLRRNPRDGALCTLEAIARALGVLEGADVEARLMETLARFVERSLRVRAGRVDS